MSYKVRTMAGAIGSVLSVVPSWIGMFLDHPNTLDWLFDYAIIWAPALVFAFGCFTGYSFCKWISGEDDYRKLVRRIPSLPMRERAALLIVYRVGEVWAQGDMVGATASLYANKYLHLAYSGGSRGECYIMPSGLRQKIDKNKKAIKAIEAAANTAS